MADLSQFMTYDDSKITASTGTPEAVPSGDYDLQQESSEIITTRDGSGMLLRVTLSVLSGEYEGRKIFPQFNIVNKNVQAQNIGVSEFKALCLACGVDYEQAKRETESLNFMPFRAKIGFDKQNINAQTGVPYPPKNRVLKYYPFGGTPEPQRHAAPSSPAPAPAAAARAPAASSAGTPWDKR